MVLVNKKCDLIIFSSTSPKTELFKKNFISPSNLTVWSLRTSRTAERVLSKWWLCIDWGSDCYVVPDLFAYALSSITLNVSYILATSICLFEYSHFHIIKNIIEVVDFVLIYLCRSVRPALPLYLEWMCVNIYAIRLPNRKVK